MGGRGVLFFCVGAVAGAVEECVGARMEAKGNKNHRRRYFFFCAEEGIFFWGHVWRRNLKGTIAGGIFFCVRGAAGVENHRNEPISGSERNKLHVLERIAQ